MRAVVLLLCLAGCRGVGERDAAHAARPPAPIAILARLFRGHKAGRHVRVEPAPILSDHEVGFGLTVRW